MAVRAGSTPRVSQNWFVRNGLSDHAARSFIVEPGARPQLLGNYFHGVIVDVFTGLNQTSREALLHDNLFLGPPAAPGARGAGHAR
jgi:hypothetical protein